MKRSLCMSINDLEGNKTITFKLFDSQGCYTNEIDSYSISSCASYSCIDKIIVFEKEIKEKGFTNEIKTKITKLL